MTRYELFVGAVVVFSVAFALYKKMMRSKVNEAAAPATLFSDVQLLFKGPLIQRGKTLSSWQLTGIYGGQSFQVQTIIDTLSTRKLPSLWMMITLPEPQPLPGILDLMMRPSGPTTFSNFDFLTHSLPLPSHFPDNMVIRSDSLDMTRYLEFVKPHLATFEECHGKEFLMTPKGLRIVTLAAEADHARYGVLREANFGEQVLNADLAKQSMDILRIVHQQLRNGKAND